MPARPLIGRSREVDQARRVVVEDGARLLTLTGPGGVGKTRLALAVAGVLEADFAHGVVFVDLSPIRDSTLVIGAVARACGVVHEGPQPPLVGLMRVLGERARLLVLDNCEHVLAAAPAFAELLDACPSVCILATSREPLHLRWEWEFPVRPLARPDLTDGDDATAVEALSRNPSVALFVQRARAVQPSFALTSANARAVAELCARLDGLPLAIELAAARTRLLPPAALLSRLERRLDLQAAALDAPERHRTLRAAITWSYDLLTQDQQALFRRLSVFVGGCTLEAAERVCFPRERRDEAPPDVLEGIHALVERNLLLAEELPDATDDDGDPLVRFRFLETVRELAVEQLEMCGEAPWVHAAHSAYYLALAVAAEAAVRGPRQRIWLDRLEHDWDNLRSALRWLLNRRDAAALEDVGRLAWALWHFWWARGHLGEARRWCTELLARTAGGENVPVRARARAQWVVATAALDQGDYDSAPSLIAECLALFRQLGDEHGIGRGLLAEGWAAPIAGDLDRALAAHHASVEHFRMAGDDQGVVLALAGLGNTATLAGDLPAATTYNEQALELARTLGDTHSQAQVLEALGLVALRQRAIEHAARNFQESVALCRAVGSLELLCYCLIGLAGVAQASGAAAHAATLAGAADGLRERADLGVWPVRQALQQDIVRQLRGALPSSAFDQAWSAGRRMNVQQVTDLALASGSEKIRGEPPSKSPTC